MFAISPCTTYMYVYIVLIPGKLTVEIMPGLLPQPTSHACKCFLIFYINACKVIQSGLEICVIPISRKNKVGRLVAIIFLKNLDTFSF